MERLILLLLIFTSLWTQADKKLLMNSCIECHDEDLEEGKFRVDLLADESFTRENIMDWEKVYFQIRNDFMPPKKAKINADEKSKLLSYLASEITGFYQSNPQVNHQGRRLNKSEFINSLQDLVGLKRDMTPFSKQIPIEADLGFYFKSPAELSLSPETIARYHQVTDDVFDYILTQPSEMPQRTTFKIAFKESNIPSPHTCFGVVGKEVDPTYYPNGKSKSDDKPYSTGVAIIKQMPPTRDGTRRFQWRAPTDGLYRFKVGLWAFKNKQGSTKLEGHGHTVPVEIRSGRRFIKLIDIDNERKEYVFETFLNKFETLTINPTFIKSYKNLAFGKGLGGHLAKDKRKNLPYVEAVKKWAGEGLVYENLIVEGPLFKTTQLTYITYLFGAHKVLSDSKNEGSTWRKIPEYFNHHFKETLTEKEVVTLIHRFAYRAYRGKYKTSDVSGFLSFYKSQFEETKHQLKALINTYKFILYSPQFLMLNYEHESLELTDLSLASKLSYFIWNSAPDMKLLILAHNKNLKDPTVLNQQLQRMIQHENFQRFNNNFLDHWLNLKELNRFEPDRSKFPIFKEELRLSLKDEPLAIFNYIVKNNLPISETVDSNYTFINKPLAGLYSLPTDKMNYTDFKKVMLTSDSTRGGLMTTAALLKATANGVDTSPIIRGNFIMDKFFGIDVGSPPEVESLGEQAFDAKTSIRERFDIHKKNESCYKCHYLIDPPGFALESFDAIGQWRDDYTVQYSGEKGLLTHRMPVDAAGDLEIGSFQGVRGFKSLLRKKPEIIAYAFLRQLFIYAHGREVNLDEKFKLLNLLKGHSLKTQDLIKSLVESDIFKKI